MDLRDDPESAAFRAELRAWLRDNVTPSTVPPVAARWTDPDAVRAYTRALDKAGYAGLTWPAQYGGGGQPAGYQAIFLDETARAGADEHIGVIGLGMVGPTIIARGTSTQKQFFLPRILSGEIVFCQGFSEPDAGSDLAAVTTRALADGDEFVIDGRKLWSSYAHMADYCLLLVRSGDPVDKHGSLTCLLVDMSLPGILVHPIPQINGANDFNEIVFDAVRVPSDAVLGGVGDGWRVAMTTLAHERGTFGFTLTARLGTQFERLVATVRAAGRTADPLVRDRIADLYVELSGLRYTNDRTLATLARTGEVAAETAIVKLRWSLAHQEVTTLGAEVASDITGPDGDAWRVYWRWHRLRSRANTIEGGTSEILRDIVAQRVLRLPRAR